MLPPPSKTLSRCCWSEPSLARSTAGSLSLPLAPRLVPAGPRVWVRARLCLFGRVKRHRPERARKGAARRGATSAQTTALYANPRTAGAKTGANPSHRYIRMDGRRQKTCLGQNVARQTQYAAPRRAAKSPPARPARRARRGPGPRAACPWSERADARALAAVVQERRGGAQDRLGQRLYAPPRARPARPRPERLFCNHKGATGTRGPGSARKERHAEAVRLLAQPSGGVRPWTTTIWGARPSRRARRSRSCRPQKHGVVQAREAN